MLRFSTLGCRQDRRRCSSPSPGRIRVGAFREENLEAEERPRSIFHEDVSVQRGLHGAEHGAGTISDAMTALFWPFRFVAVQLGSVGLFQSVFTT